MGTVGAKIWGVVNTPALGAGLGVANLIVGGITCGKVCSIDNKVDSFTSELSKTSKVVIDNSKDAYEMSCVAKDTVTKMNSAVNDISGYFKEMKELDSQNPPQQMPMQPQQPQQMQQMPMQPQQVQANWANLTQKQIFEEGKAAALAEIERQKEAESKDMKIQALEAEIANLKNGTSEDEKIPAWLNGILEKNPDKALDLINAFVGGKNQQPQQHEVDPLLAAKAAEYDRLMAMEKEAERQKEADAQQKFADKIQAKFDSYDEALSSLGTAVGNLNALLTSMQNANDANKGSNKKNG